MSQVITNAFEQYWQSCLAAEKPVVLDEFILADIPNLDITSPIDPETGLPPESQIVHRQNVDQRGRINNNAVAYTIVMDTTVGDFSFNAMYLRNKQNGVIGMIVYKGRETKLKTDQTTGQTGNSLVKSMLMGYDQAAEATLTHVDAGTWQIDYAARLRGQDEDLRQLASQLYGHHTFIGDGFKVVLKDGAHQVTPGVAIVGGLRIELKQPEVIYPGTKPSGVWVDVHRAGSLLSEHQNHFTIITSVADLTDHVDGSGYQHYVAKLGTVQADNSVVDGRGYTDGGGTGSIPDTFALWKRSMAEAGYDLIGQFGTKLTIQNVKQVLLSKDGTEVYQWQGALPKDVGKNDTTENSGGVGDGAWAPTSYESLRAQLAANGGAALVGPGVITRGADKFSILQGRSGEQFGADYTRGIGVVLAEPFIGSGFTVNTAKLNSITITDDRLNVVDDLIPGTKVDGLYVNHKFGGAGTKGGRHAAEFILEQTGLTEATNTDRNYVGCVGFATSSTGDGGTAPETAKGAYFGGNFYGTLTAGAMNVLNVTGAEFNAGISDGASANIRTGIQIGGTKNNRGTVIDTAISVGNLGSACTWRVGLGFGPQNGGEALGPDSRAIAVDATSIDRVLSLSSLDNVNYIIYHNKVKLTTKALLLEDVGAYVAVGSPTTASTVQTLYRASGLSPTYDARVLVSGGNATDGQGNYEIKAAAVTYNCSQRPNSDNAYDYGAASFRGRTAYFGTGTINTSDAREKTVPLPIDDAVLDAWGDVQLVTFQWLNMVQQKGDDVARWHFGVIAQQVRDAFSARSLDGTRYGLLCYDEWEATPETTAIVPAVLDEDSNIITPERIEVTQDAMPAGNRWGIRADQCLFLEAAYQRRNYQRLLARIEVLEAN